MSEPTLAQRVRLFVYEHFLEHARAPVVEELMTKFALTRSECESTLAALVESRGVALVPGSARILMAWPFSAVTTPFVARARGRDYMTNCAWDAIAMHSMLHEEPVDVESFCHHCATPIHIELRAGRATMVEPSTAIVYLALRPTEWWEDIITTCSNTMVFFCSAEHRDASELSAPADRAASLTPQQAHDVSVPLYEGRLRIDYARPGRDQLNEHFASLGLAAPYWRI